jgi:hypothetical protein
MMTTMKEILREEREETRKLVMGLVYPTYPSAQSNGSVSPPVDTPPQDPWQEYDQMSLDPGIEAVLARESEEERLQALLRERAVSQGRLRELQEQERRLMEAEGSSLGPWLGGPSGEE